MQINFEACKGSRLNKRFYGITVYNNNNNSHNYWWDKVDKKWITNLNSKNEFSNFCPCKSLKAFKRHVRKHMKHINNVDIRLASNFVGYDCWITK